MGRTRPPYPPEFRAEPVLGLQAAERGLAIIDRILAGARRHLTAAGILVVEAGNTATEVRRRHRALPFTWLEFERGGGGVFLLRAGDLPA